MERKNFRFLLILLHDLQYVRKRGICSDANQDCHNANEGGSKRFQERKDYGAAEQHEGRCDYCNGRPALNFGEHNQVTDKHHSAREHQAMPVHKQTQ